MRVYIHQLIVRVASLDSNPASVAVTIDGALADLRTDHPLGRILTTDTSAAGNEVQEREIPDEPFNGEPDNDAEMREHDAWVNNHVYRLFE